MLFSLSTKPAHAIPVFDAGAFGQRIGDQIMQAGTLAKEVIIAGNSYLTTANTYLTMYNNTIFRPLQDMMMLVTIFSSGDKIKSLILGGVSGEAALLIQNPERYIKQQGVNALKANVNYISKADGIYSNSIMDSVVSQARVRSDLGGRLAYLSKSSIPQAIQDDMCEDSKLEGIALNDVTDAEGNYTLEDLRDRKAELYTSLCEGDPNTDKDLAQALTTAGEQTGAGGWGVFNAKTGADGKGGDNNFTKTNLALNAIEADRLLKEAMEAADLTRGNGIVSKTECLVRSTDETTGLDVCLEKSIQSPAYQLSESFKSAINAPLDILKNSYGTGGTVSSILSSIGSIVGTISSMTGTLNSMKSTVSGLSTLGPDGDTSLQINIKGTPGYAPITPGGGSNPEINTPINASTTYTQDLVNNPTGKASVVKPLSSILGKHLTLLTTLEKSDKSYLSAIDAYMSKLNTVQSCYQQLITSFPTETLTAINYFPETILPSIASDQRVVNALAYYNSKKTATETLKTEITNELSLVDQTRALVNGTQNTITNSNSTEEIIATLDNYNSTVENNNLPSPVNGAATREGDVVSYKADTDKDSADYFSAVGNDSLDGNITKLNRQCVAIRTEEQAKREAARAAQAEASVVQGG